MIYNNINFYEESIKGQSEEEFVKGHKHQPLSEEQLKEVYALITKKKKAIKPSPSLN